MKTTLAWVEKLEAFLYFGLLGAFAALVGYLYQIAKENGKSLSLLMLFITAMVGFYMGMVFGQLIPSDWGNRDALVLLVGATGMKGFELIVSHSKKAVPALLQGLAGGKTPPAEKEDQG